jgi:membrane protein implicated in regulation of membrane protease activity
MTWWMWLVGGLVLLAFELLTPGGFFILFFGLAALVVGVLSALGLAGPVWLQVVLFVVLSVAFLMLFRRPLLDWLRARELERPPVDALESEIAILLEDLSPGGVAKAELRGTSWSARTREAGGLARGQRCRIERVEGLTLWLRPEIFEGGAS